ncbi:MAG: hypothetical protein J7517_09695 [Sphingobium yanoikuyae]|uniref:hypothetical protein n=1 Tax=Sphingobium yanoikuyae TaxID=13690 RepID=UPI001B13AC20|nr:hypothetical protein [Sphingobium yanoikuyae]
MKDSHVNAAARVSDGWFDWPFQSAHQGDVAGYGFWLGVAGFAVSLIGFCVTIYQLRKTRSAADAAKQEAIRIEKTLLKYELANETVKGMAALDTARKYVRSDLWMHVTDSYETVRNALLALKSEFEELTENQNQQIDNACNYIQNTCARIERGIHNNGPKVDKAKLISVMAEHAILLSDLNRMIQKGVVK